MWQFSLSCIGVGGPGARHRSEVPGQCDLHPTPSQWEVVFREPLGAVPQCFPNPISLPLGVGLLLSTEQYSRVTVDQHFFLHSLSVGRKSTTCYWPTPSEGTGRQISQFCRDYRASWPCYGHCNVTVGDVSLTRSMRQPSLWFWQQGL